MRTCFSLPNRDIAKSFRKDTFQTYPLTQSRLFSLSLSPPINPFELPQTPPPLSPLSIPCPSIFTLLYLGIDVNGPQSELLVLVNHPSRGLPVEFSIWLDAVVPPPGPQHPTAADAHPRSRHHPFPCLLLAVDDMVVGMTYHKERIAGDGRLSATPIRRTRPVMPLEREKERERDR